MTKTSLRRTIGEDMVKTSRRCVLPLACWRQAARRRPGRRRRRARRARHASP